MLPCTITTGKNNNPKTIKWHLEVMVLHWTTPNIYTAVVMILQSAVKHKHKRDGPKATVFSILNSSVLYSTFTHSIVCLQHKICTKLPVVHYCRKSGIVLDYLAVKDAKKWLCSSQDGGWRKDSHHFHTTKHFWLFGSSGRVVNSLDFPWHCLSPLATSNAYFLHNGGWWPWICMTAPTLKAFLKACSQNVSGNNQ